EAIRARLDAVECLYRNQRTLEKLRACLGNCLDLERLASRVAMEKAHAKDLLGVKVSLDTIREASLLLGPEARTIPELDFRLGPEVEEELRSVSDLIGRAIQDEPSVLLTEGNLIRPGFDAELDSLRDLRDSSRSVLESYLEEERAATGIQNLRIRYNRILGYYLEVTKGALSQVPGHFIRRQSLSTGERYTTDRLADLESRINGAQEKIVELERERFLEVRAAVRGSVPRLLEAARACARVDCLASFAYTATARGYTRPEVDDSGVLRISEGRHPVVEAHMAGGDFVPNDTRLDSGGVSFALITGHNMAGKSTYLRQTALIVLMAQAGSFVPAGEARIGVVDRIFCRVGAQDNLARGESTFLVEMHETAYILNNAGPRSLVIMDEVGRGTGTLDGLAIAWAAAEYLLDALGCRTLFATHYHELTALDHPKMVNRSLSVQETAGEVVFLKRVVEGPAAGSYGLHVAGLAGIPPAVLARARQVRENLARKERDLPAAVASPRPPAQAALFSNEELVLEELRSLDPDRITPLEALTRLAKLKKLL
ncbi:MAG: DNA mismatch repair protein MutS, partial [Treponema sp.]|nr:DNA mismatch repair protein MutS [Treponema sp.]